MNTDIGREKNRVFPGLFGILTDLPYAIVFSNLKLIQEAISPTWTHRKAIAGFRQPFAYSHDLNHGAKNETTRSTRNCRLKMRLNRVFWREEPFKQYFLLAWTQFPLEPRNRIMKKANRGRYGLRIDHRSVIQFCPHITKFEGWFVSLQTLFYAWIPEQMCVSPEYQPI